MLLAIMSNNQIFNLEKIKEFAAPLEKLQVKVNQLSEVYSSIKINIQIIENNFTDKILLSQIEDITADFSEINKKLALISKSNISVYLDFQDRLIRKYKDTYKDRLKKLSLGNEKTKVIGLSLIERKKISKIINSVSFVPSVGITQWLELLDSLKLNTLFLKVIKSISTYYQELIQKRLTVELNAIPTDMDILLRKEFEKTFLRNPTISFKEFLEDKENKLTKAELTSKEKFVRKSKDKEEIAKLKRTQKDQKETYDNYLKLSDREFKRQRRKKSREKLADISTISKEIKEIEISDEISEKIKKFKSQLGKSFEDKYLVQKDEDIDPLDLIRKRKERKEKEYKEYKNHFEEV